MKIEMALKLQCILVFVYCACCLFVRLLSVGESVGLRVAEGLAKCHRLHWEQEVGFVHGAQFGRNWNNEKY